MSNFFEGNPWYVILLINLIIWAGIFGYASVLKKKAKVLLKEKKL